MHWFPLRRCSTRSGGSTGQHRRTAPRRLLAGKVFNAPGWSSSTPGCPRSPPARIRIPASLGGPRRGPRPMTRPSPQWGISLTTSEMVAHRHADFHRSVRQRGSANSSWSARPVRAFPAQRTSCPTAAVIIAFAEASARGKSAKRKRRAFGRMVGLSASPDHNPLNQCISKQRILNDRPVPFRLSAARMRLGWVVIRIAGATIWRSQWRTRSAPGRGADRVRWRKPAPRTSIAVTLEARFPNPNSSQSECRS